MLRMNVTFASNAGAVGSPLAPPSPRLVLVVGVLPLVQLQMFKNDFGGVLVK